MNKDELRTQLTDLNAEILSDLKKDLDEERSKPINERDESYISELEEMIAQTEEEIKSESEARSLENTLKMLDEYEQPKKKRLFKIISVAAAILIVFLGLNTASIKVLGQNVFSAAYQFTKGGITISTDDPKSDELVVSPSDPYGMKAKCAEYGFFPDTPSYIPEGFSLDSINEHTGDSADILIFLYIKDNSKLVFKYLNYKTDSEIPTIVFPTDTYNLEEVESDDHITYILKEDDQFTATYISQKIKYVIFSEKIENTECQKILESMS